MDRSLLLAGLCLFAACTTINVMTNELNCSACGHKCAAGQVCTAGACI